MTIDQDQLRDRLIAAAQTVLVNDRLTASDNFFEHGGDSFNVIELCQHVEPYLGLEIPLEVVWEADDFTELAAELSQLAVQRS
jgi:acyl carrier protein